MGYAIVKAVDGLRLHREPNLDSERMELMPFRDRVRVITRGHGNFWYVGWQSPKLGWLQGYAWSGFLSEVDDEPIEPCPPPPPARAFDVLVAVLVAVALAAVAWGAWSAFFG